MNRVFILLILFAMSSALSAQSLLDTEGYQRSQSIQSEAREALEDGDYALAIELSKQAQELADEAYDQAEAVYYGYIAREAKVRAEGVLDALDRSDASFSEIQEIAIEDGRAFYRDGIVLFDDEEYELSALAFLNVLATLDASGAPAIAGIDMGAFSAAIAQIEVPQRSIGDDGDMMDDDAMMDDGEMMADDDTMMDDGEMMADDDTMMDDGEMMADDDTMMDDDMAEGEMMDDKKLPRYYRVRLIPEDRDSFSKIAAYPFVYSDYEEWPRLYEANKEKIVDPDNPDLIHPGQFFEIPPLADEIRAGEWHSPATEQ